MNKQEIINFFDSLADKWDDDMIRNDAVIDKILEVSRFQKGVSVLDIACGTGVLIPDYIKRSITDITGVDISPNMLKIAKEKFPHVDFICCDAETYNFERTFDRIMIYNAFPHFPNQDKLIKHLSSFLNEGGVLTIAHGMSLKQIDAIHENSAKNVSLKLPSSKELSHIIEKYLEPIECFDDEYMYIVSAIKR